MTRKSIREYAGAVCKRYMAASKVEKGKILDEFCQTTGYNRKAVIRLLRRPVKAVGGRRGRRQRYGLAVVQALKRVWEASDRICAKRLVPFIPELLASLERHDEIELTKEVRTQLLELSAATADRLLKPYRERGIRRPYNQSRSASALKSQIPIRTFGEWADVKPGSLQADLVLHCGESTAGFHLTTLCTVDVATGWTECEAVWGKGQQRVGTGMHHVRQRLPFRLEEIHTDNGGEFVNEVLYPWCKREGIRFTRGRPYKKNDQAYVEQKNWSVVRRLVGYDRYSAKAAHEEMRELYCLVGQYVNFFQPLRKLIGKERVGGKIKKQFDRAQTPYQRLLAAEVLAEGKKESLRELYESLDPVKLRAKIDAMLASLWELAERRQAVKAGDHESVEGLAV